MKALNDYPRIFCQIFRLLRPEKKNENEKKTRSKSHRSKPQCGWKRHFRYFLGVKMRPLVATDHSPLCSLYEKMISNFCILTVDCRDTKVLIFLARLWDEGVRLTSPLWTWKISIGHFVLVTCAAVTIVRQEQLLATCVWSRIIENIRKITIIRAESKVLVIWTQFWESEMEISNRRRNEKRGILNVRKYRSFHAPVKMCDQMNPSLDWVSWSFLKILCVFVRCDPVFAIQTEFQVSEVAS